jgi:hypothetical protein
MEINSGHSNVQIAIAVQPQAPTSQARGSGNEYSYVDETPSPVIQVIPSPSVNTSGQEVGNLINTWA